MSSVERLVIATANRHKVHEIRSILESLGGETAHIALAGLGDYPGVVMPVEDGDSFLANARIKACSVSCQTGEVCLADDSGLVVDGLGGEPGIHSARFLGEDATDSQRNQAILAMLAQRPEAPRTARFVCAAVIAFPDGQVLEVQETCEGQIARTPSGDGGFGYDPIFYFPEFACTLAEVPSDRKNQVSHRGKAMRGIIRKLRELL